MEDPFSNNKNYGDNRLRRKSPPDKGSGIPKTTEKIKTPVSITIAILGSTILITMYGETTLLPAIRDIIRDFNTSYSTSSWILTAYLISGAVATPIAGKLSDIYGRKKMILSIFVIYIVGISIGGISTNLPVLLVARIIQGIGISMFPTYSYLARLCAVWTSRYVFTERYDVKRLLSHDLPITLISTL